MGTFESLTANLKDLILKAVASYNRYRSPEATAKLVNLEQTKFVIEFSGSFCLTCGVEAYFEDFIYELKTIDNRISIGIRRFRQTGPESYEVEYAFVTSEVQ